MVQACKFSQKYAIVQFLEDIDEGHEYASENWPLHTTIVDTFAVTSSVDDVIAALIDALDTHPIAVSEAADDRLFGENGRTHVVLIDRTKSLIKLHMDVLAVLEKHGLTLNDPQFAREGFLPHATVQEHARLKRGDIVECTALSLVDMFPNEDPYARKVLKIIKIGG